MRKNPISGFRTDPPLVSGGFGTQGWPFSRDRSIASALAHAPADSRDTSTTDGSPVFSRAYRAALIPPAMVIAPIESPKAGPGIPSSPSTCGIARPIAPPARPNVGWS